MTKNRETLILATTNQGKVRELQTLMTELDYEIQSLAEYPEIGEITEDGQTFVENALIKARAVAKATNKIVLADDSGLMVDALDGAPGIYSARFAGAERDDLHNIRKLLHLMQGVAPELRGAQFCCALAIVFPDGREYVTEGICRGMITQDLCGTGGFGYDPIFYVPACEQTFAELSMTDKNMISHRGQANRQAVEILKNAAGGARP